MKLDIQKFATYTTINSITEADTTMQSLNWGVFLQSQSKLNVTVSVSSTVRVNEVLLDIEGQKYSYKPPSNSREFTHTFTTLVLRNTGTETALVITKIGGSSFTTSSTYNVVQYMQPQITQAIVKRVNSSNVESTNGEYLNYSFGGVIENVGSNDHRFRIGYREQGIGSYTYADVETSSYTCNKSNIKVDGWYLDASKTYDIIFEAIDTFYPVAAPIYETKIIESGFDLMNFNASGKSMAIGMVSKRTSNEECLDIALDTYIDGGRIYGEHELYNNATGSNSSVTLSESASGYTYFDIYYRSNDSTDNVGFERVYNPDDKMVNLTYTWYQGVNCYVKSALFTISGTSMTSSQGIQYEFSSGGNINITQADNIYITRVIGLK